MRGCIIHNEALNSDKEKKGSFAQREASFILLPATSSTHGYVHVGFNEAQLLGMGQPGSLLNQGGLHFTPEAHLLVTHLQLISWVMLG